MLTLSQYHVKTDDVKRIPQIIVMRKHKISASILAADFLNLEKEVKNVIEAGADLIHIDVMDGKFVPNITMGVDVVKAINSRFDIPIEVHLMIKQPEDHVEIFAKAGADTIIFHFESTTHHDRLIGRIHNLGKKAGISLIPSTNESVLKYLYNILDQILVMTVNPGFCGQKFISTQLDKVANIKKMLESLNLENKIDISVDGGINKSTAAKSLEKGADIIVVGSTIFSSKNYKKTISEL